MNKIFYTFIFTAVALVGCGGGEQEIEQSDMTKQVHQAELTEVQTMVLQPVTFDKELISNGRLEASRKAKLTFSGAGIIDKVNVREGQHVAKGAVVAQLEGKTLALELEQAQLAYEKAQMDFADKLLDFGYRIDSLGSVPQEVVKVAQIRSGYKDAEIALRRAKQSYNDASLTAPFAGKVASVKGVAYERPSEEICTIVDDAVMKVKFTILESELGFVKSGQQVRVIPFNDPEAEHTGKILSINPLVDDKGQIAITAQIPNRSGTLLDGQNVKIFIEESLPSQLVVPKSAVVVRDKMDVLFLYDNGRTVWTYVNVLHANSHSYVVGANEDRSSELAAGDTVIISGNLNIGDNVRVERVR